MLGTNFPAPEDQQTGNQSEHSKRQVRSIGTNGFCIFGSGHQARLHGSCVAVTSQAGKGYQRWEYTPR